MNKLFITCFFGIVSLCSMAKASSYAGGDGSKDNPFLISNADELAKLANDVNTIANVSRGKYYKLTQDIIINEGVNQLESTTLKGGKSFPQTPTIGYYASEADYKAFQGVFDGNGHAICGIYLVPNAQYYSLFRMLEDAEIKNLGIRDAFIYAGAYLSCIAARMVNSKIINCYVTNSQIIGWGSNSGPIAAQVLGTSKIQNCYTAMTMMTKNDTGGIVGRIGNGDTNEVIIENCVSNTIINTSKTNKAGIAAVNSVGSIVRNCYYTSASGANAVWTSQDKGTTEKCQQMTLDEMQKDDFIALLNSNSETIPGACRWKKGESIPMHNYTENTPEEIKKEISAMATDPIPTNGDMHADMDACILKWTAAADGKTVKQYIHIGTDSVAIAKATISEAVATLPTETNYYISSKLSPLTTYYWRVDREDTEGKVTEGEVWLFQPRQLAFPGAEGYGRFARGGRGGKVVWVTNLNDSGEGSLRWALTNKQGPRTVMFKVSGIIDMNFRQCNTDDLVTIAAQSAPGKGVCIKHSDIGVGSDCVVRFLRARRGLGTSAETGNAIGTTYSNHTILDHVTASWGTDETFSSRGSQNISFQRCMISEALGIAGHRNYPEGTNHGYAATIGGDIGSFHHNLLANCEGRNWSMGGGTDANGAYAGRLDIFNNVVYNWNKRTTDGGAHEVNFVNNYYKAGEALYTTTLFTLQIEGNLKGTQSAYISGNIRDNKDGSLTEDALNNTYRLSILDGRNSLDWTPFVNQPFFPSYAKIESAKEAYKSVLSDVGANQPVQDQTDQRIINETLNRTYTYVGSKSGIKGEIDNEIDAGGFEEYPETKWPDNYDTDMDGLPDWWEEIRGLNVNSPVQDFSDSNADNDENGYTELEEYLDFLAQPHLIVAPGSSIDLDIKKLFAGYTASPVYHADSESTAFSASLVNGNLIIKAGEKHALGTVNLSVRDSDNASFERRLIVAVSNHYTTGIRGVATAKASECQDVYDLRGCRVLHAIQKGFYIQNGKKFVVK